MEREADVCSGKGELSWFAPLSRRFGAVGRAGVVRRRDDLALPRECLSPVTPRRRCRSHKPPPLPNIFQTNSDRRLGQAATGNIKMPREIYDEVAGSSDLLEQWLRQMDVRKALVLTETTNFAVVQRVLSQGPYQESCVEVGCTPNPT